MWLISVVVVIVVAAAIYCFARLAGQQTRWLSRPTTRRAEDLYDDYADPPRKPSDR